MKIKQIEMIGFKSFAEKTLFPIHNGVTCIVGPNGCGKSNIVDAFRWVLGEQSAKSLRGGKMEEVIFQGSATKKQKGMAEVALVISQSNPAIQKSGNDGQPEDNTSDLITVSRRLYRSGESEYILNKRRCRLKDIKDIFFDTGFDAESYSVMDQGKITEIINAKPCDRRYLIEEIAGIMKYKVKRAEALSKLESSKQNLQRISDIIYEVKRQINSLDRHVKRAERYKSLTGELKVIEIKIAKMEFTKLNSSLNSLLFDIERIREVDSAKRGEFSTIENIVEKKTIELLDKEKTLSELESILQKKERGISNSEKQIALLRADIENKKREISRLTNQHNEIEAKSADIAQKLDELNDAKDTLISNVENISGELKEKKEEISGMAMAIEKMESEIEDKRRELFKTSEKLSNKKNELHKLQSTYETLKYRESVSLRDIETTKGGIDTLLKAVRESEDFIKIKTDEYLKIQSLKESLLSEIAQLGEEIENKRSVLSKERERLASSISRLNSLQELIIDKPIADFLSGVNLLGGEAKLGHAMPLLLSDIITANRDFEIAIESALSEKINSLITDNLKDALLAIKLIKEKQLGKTGVLYAGFCQMQNAKVQNKEDIKKFLTSQSAIIGMASDFINFENKDSSDSDGKKNSELLPLVKHSLLNTLKNTYIVKDLQSAIDILSSDSMTSQLSNSTIYLVTLDGEVISSKGWIFAGRGKETLKRKREMKELQKVIDEQRIKINDIESAIDALTNDTVAQKGSQKNTENSIIELEKKISLTSHSLKNQRDELERKTKRLSSLNTEILTISQERDSFSSFIMTKTEEIDVLQKESEAIIDETAVTQKCLASTRVKYETAMSHLTDMKLAITSYREKIDAAGKERDNIMDMSTELEGKKELTIKEIRKAEEKIRESFSELQRLKEDIKAMILNADGMRQEKMALKDAINSENHDLISHGNALKKIRLYIDENSQQLSELNAKAVESRLRKENLYNSMVQKYGVDIQRSAEAERNCEIEKEENGDAEAKQKEGEGRINELNGQRAYSPQRALGSPACPADAGRSERIQNKLFLTLDSLKFTAGKINERLRELGSVNLGTIEEYDELKRRHDFLTKQQQDLTISIAELEEAISRINITTKRRLKEAYDALRAKFSEVFSILFGGGKSDIILTDEGNILETGLEIIAKPPGKKLQSLNLLSGGEKALTSLALLFGGFLIKPSPLSILDEVDAHLDESNTVRFAQMIKKLSNETQFIVITHNRTTMEAADYIYGITMENPGASKVISLQLAEGSLDNTSK